MNAILPNRKTRKPDRAGLSHYEILADGLIHAAAIFGIDPGDQFVERVATLAWANGVYAVQHNARRAAQVAQLLGESLEAGQSEATRLCDGLAAEVDHPDDAFAAVRNYYSCRYSTRALSAQEPSNAGLIRQMIGEATLGGIMSRGLAPDLYKALAAQSDGCRNEEVFLTSRVWQWSHNDGLPIDHPFLELVASLYRGHPLDRDLVCEAVAAHLPKILDLEDPWSLEHWLRPAWKQGIQAAKFAPDQVAKVAGEFDEEERQANLHIFNECVIGTAAPNERVDLAAAYSRYLVDWNPYGLGEEATRYNNPRLLAARAYDFAMWMGLVAGMPASLGGKRSDL